MTRIPAVEEITTPTGPTWRLGETPWREIAPAAGPHARVIIDNDFAGDPDDLYQLVHHLLSPGVDIRLVVASHLHPQDPFDPSGHSAEHAERIVRDVFGRMGLESDEVIVRGADRGLVDASSAQSSPAVDAIIAEAMRADSRAPLYYLAGGGLTDLASALLIEPRIAERMTLVWIGGAEHAGLAVPPPKTSGPEYNLRIDLRAGQVVFAQSALPMWQVPRDVYRQCLVSDVELRRRVAVTGPLGRYLYDEIAGVVAAQARRHPGAAESYALGDSPLVLLTALQSLFEPDPASSRYALRQRPAISDDGAYVHHHDAAPMRVYTHVDTRLMFEDMYLKLDEFERWRRS